MGSVGGGGPPSGSGGAPGGGGGGGPGSGENAGQASSSSSTSPNQRAGPEVVGMATATVVGVVSEGGPVDASSDGREQQLSSDDGAGVNTARTLDTQQSGDAQQDGGLNSRRHLALGAGSGHAGSNAGMSHCSGGGQTVYAGSNAGMSHCSGGGQTVYVGSNAGTGYYQEGQYSKQPSYTGSKPVHYNPASHGGQSSGQAEVPGRYGYQRSYSAPRGHGSYPPGGVDPRDLLSFFPPPLHPHSTLQQVEMASGRPSDYLPASVQPTYQPHPQQPLPPHHPQAPPPSLHPPRHYPYPYHHHNPTSIGQSELPTQPHPPYGSGLAGGWGQYYNMPHSLSSGSSSSSSYVSSHTGGEGSSVGSGDFSSIPGVQYRYLGSSSLGDSQSQLLGSYSQPSSLDTLSSEVGRYPYGPQSAMGSLGVTTGGGGSGGERCHSFPLTQQVLSPAQYCRIPEEDIAGPQGGQPHPQYHQQWEANRSTTASVQQQGQLFVSSSQTQPSGEDLARQLDKSLVLTENTPAGQSEGGAGQQATASDTKHALLTMLDSDRLHISEQPQDTVTRLEERAVLTCRAHARDALAKDAKPKLQWYKGEGPLVGEESAELVFERVEKRDIGLYYCIVTHPDEDAVKKCSQVAQLSIGEPGESWSG